METITFINLTKIPVKIEMELAIWLNRFTDLNVSVIENTKEYYNQREKEKIKYNKNNYDVDIYNFTNHNDIPELNKRLSENLLIYKIDFHEDLVSYLKHINKLYLLVIDNSHIKLGVNLISRISEIYKNLEIEFVFLSKTNVLHEHLLFYNYMKENNHTFFKYNINQIFHSSIYKNISNE